MTKAKRRDVGRRTFAARALDPSRSSSWLLIAGLTVVFVFVLPLWVGHPDAGFYSAYTVGFSNRLATLAVVGLSLAVTATLILNKQVLGERVSDDVPLPFGFLLAACLAALLYTVFFGWLMVRSGTLSPDADYFLSRLAEVRYVHGRIYQDAEFAYGPLLFLLLRGAQALPGLGVGQPLAGYLLADLAGQVSGLVITFLVIRDLEFHRAYAVAAMALVLAVTLRPSLGLNYTMLRFGTPLLLVLWAGKVRNAWLRTAVFSFGLVFCLGISPEVGIAFFAGCVAVSLVYAWRQDGWQFLPVLGCLAGGSLFLFVVGEQYLYGVRHLAIGMLNLVVTPVPNVLVLLIAAIFIAPLAVTRRLKGSVDEAAAMAGFYLVSLAMLSAALGLCDELHTSFDGVGVFLLSLLAASNAAQTSRRLWAQIWVGVLGLCVAALPLMESIKVAGTKRELVTRSETEDPGADTIRLTLRPGLHFYAPAGVPVAFRDELMRAGNWAPTYFDGFDDAFDKGADEIKVKETKGADYVLLPDATPIGVGPDNRRRNRLLRFGYVYRQTRVPYQPLTLVRREVSRDFECKTAVVLAGQKEHLCARKPGNR